MEVYRRDRKHKKHFEKYFLTKSLNLHFRHIKTYGKMTKKQKNFAKSIDNIAQSDKMYITSK